jgi:hypothetical protein
VVVVSEWDRLVNSIVFKQLSWEKLSLSDDLNKTSSPQFMRDYAMKIG